jgi:biotin-(acetyl-CoA carboxylase) ligase
LLAAILSRFEHSYGRLTDSHGRAEVLRRAEQRSIVLGTMVTARLADGRSYSGIARGLASSGALELEVDGGRFPLHSAEITQLRSSRGPPSA